jgi:DNA-directed RNA polymerase specialized sigma24 family protein
VLLPGLWDVTRGATIRTYFVGACILHFPNVYNRSAGGTWLDSLLTKEDPATTLEASADENEFGRPDQRALVMSALRKVVPDSETREIVLGTAAEYTQKEIADRLGMTRKAVEMRLSHLHRKPK